MYDRFLIAPFITGQENDLKPFLIPDDAFALLNNAYLYRGRVRKRPGTSLMNKTVSDDIAPLYSRLRIYLGDTDGSGDISTAVVAIPTGATFKIGQMFSVGDSTAQEIFTVYQANGDMYTTGAATTATFDITTGAYDIQGSLANKECYFYPANSVMGLITAEQTAVNDEFVYAFDTNFSYAYSGTGWDILSTAGAVFAWTGDEADFFLGTNHIGASRSDRYLYVTNFVKADGIRYFDGTTWAKLSIVYNAATDYVYTARIVIPFKDRLLLLNTIENVSAADVSFPNRMRWCQDGIPIAPGVTPWLEAPNKGGYSDATTTEAIIAARVLKDRLIVFFERSTWEIVHTGSGTTPFKWQQLNSEIGAESTFSTVGFDKAILGFGNVGINACNGVNVERIDSKIPDLVAEIHNENDGPTRVHGIRDFSTDLCYWSYPNADRNGTFPDKILVYNYITDAWATIDDSFTVFGYYQPNADATWSSTNIAWEESLEAWNSGTLQSQYRFIIAGNQQGFVVKFDEQDSSNSPSLQITDLSFTGTVVTITAIDHNMYPGEFIRINECQGITGLDGNIYKISAINSVTHTITINVAAISGTYTGGGTISRISNINILTKEYSFYLKERRNSYVAEVSLMVDATDYGQITVDTYISTSRLEMLNEAQASGALIGTNILETSPLNDLEDTQNRVWHSVFTKAQGEAVQLNMYFSDAQMVQPNIVDSDFQLHAMAFFAMKIGY